MSNKEDRPDEQAQPKTDAAEGAESQELSPESLDGVVGGLMASGIAASGAPRSVVPPVCISQS